MPLNLISLKTKAPYTAAKIEANIMHNFAIDSILVSVNDNDETNIDIVNPIPPRTLAPYKCLLVTLVGNLAIFNFTKIYETPNIPTCFPTKRPNMIPKHAGENILLKKFSELIIIPEFAKAKIGMIP